MLSRYGWSLLVLCLAVACQFWFTGVLLVSRQSEALLCGSIIASVFWAWCFWASLLRKRRVGLAVTGFCLVLSLALTIVCLLDMLDTSGIFLPGRWGGA